MKKIIFYAIGIVSFSCCPYIHGQTYESKHFVIHSNLDSRYITIVQANIETYYEKVLSGYFSEGWSEPLAESTKYQDIVKVYDTQGESLQIMCDMMTQRVVCFFS